MTEKLGVGIIGAGNISTSYLRLAPLFKSLDVRAVADIDPAASKARAEEYGVRARSVNDLLAADDIDVVVNLTIPDAHFAVSKSVLQAGKHVYSEKPFVLSLEQGQELKRIADAGGLRIGSAPDTFLGGTHQLARAKLDEGLIGKVTAGSAHVMSHGMEHWHPNPGFFFLPGGGPILDLGPYYITNLVQLIGPVRRVSALTTAATSSRRVTAEGPMQGRDVPVKTPTNIHALLDFANGATVTLSTSWDIWAHRHKHMELYGTEGSLFVPDPNFFAGKLEAAGRDGQINEVELWDHPFGVPNQDHPSQGSLANYRTAGLADMAQAMVDGRNHRCSFELANHVVEVMTGILAAGEKGEWVAMTTECDRPDALGPSEAAALLV